MIAPGILDIPEVFLARGWRIAVLAGEEKVIVWDARERYLARVSPTLVSRLPQYMDQDGETLKTVLWNARNDR